MKKWIFAGLLLWWVYLLRTPQLREHAVTLIMSRGPALDDTSRGGANQIDPAEDFSTLISRYPGGWYLHFTNMDQATDLLRTYPHDPVPLARWLSCTIRAVDTDSPGTEGEPKPAKEFDDLLRVAGDGEGIDPGNAFFPAAAGEVELERGRQANALIYLRRVAKCSFYDDYSEHFRKQVYTCVFGNRPAKMGAVLRLLDQAPETGPSASSLPLGGIPQALFNFLTNFQSDSVDSNSDTRILGPNMLGALETEELMMRVGMLQRTTAKTFESRAAGADLERTAIDFGDDLLANVNSSGNLAAIAAKNGQPKIAAQVRREWASLSAAAGADSGPFPTYLDEKDIWLVFEADHLERMILWSIPLCLALLALAARKGQGTKPVRISWTECRGFAIFAVTVVFCSWGDFLTVPYLIVLGLGLLSFHSGRIRGLRRPEFPIAFRYGLGALAGSLGLALLIMGDLVVMLRASGSLVSLNSIRSGHVSWAGIGWDWSGPGLGVAMPLVPWFAVALELLAVSLLCSITRRVARSPAKAGDARSGALGSWRLDDIFVAACRGMFAFSLWLPALALFGGGCWLVIARGLLTGGFFGPQMTSPPLVNSWVTVWSPVVVLLTALTAVLPWALARIPDRRASLEAARAYFVRFALGYLFVATLLFSQIETKRTLHQGAFDSALASQLDDR